MYLGIGDFFAGSCCRGLSDIDALNAQTIAWIEKAKAEGKIRYFGVTTHLNMEDVMLGAARLGWIDGIMMTYNFKSELDGISVL